ncbi:MAG: peptide chain release factor N(5)-glutamine methyltransferase [Arachnia sp.]
MRTSDAMAMATQRFKAAGLTSPVVDARLLLTHLLGATQGLILAADPSPEQVHTFEDMVQRRESGEPVQHITGLAPFRYEEVHVGPGVFIPRPETEQLVGAALQILSERPVNRRRVVELCAGSGAISLCLAREMAGVELHAVELSKDAWPYLQRNLEGIDIDLVLGDMADAFQQLNGTVDLVVANPPYVPETDRPILPADVVGQDPDLALFSGEDGLDALHVVRDVALRLLAADGWVAAEHDEKQSAAVLQLFGPPNFAGTLELSDLAGRDRHVIAKRAPSIGALRTQGPGMAGLTS